MMNTILTHITRFILLLCGLCGLSACNDFLSELPDNRAELDTEEKITKLLVSAYPDINHCLLTEMASDNALENTGATWNSTLMQEQAYRWENITETDIDSPSQLWNACYKAIAAANHALTAIEEQGNGGRDMLPQMGEALLCRAYSHFVLVNIFCQHYSKTYGDKDLGIPYMEQLETTVAPQYDRLTVAEVYQKIGDDLERGLPLISDEIYPVPKYHFNQKAAYAFAARFSLYSCRYDKAVEYATRALSANPAGLLRDWNTMGMLSISGSIRGNAFISAEVAANFLLVSSYSLWARVHGPLHMAERFTHNNRIAYYETCKVPGPWGHPNNVYVVAPDYLNTPKVIMLKLSEYFEVSDPVSGIGSPHIVLPAFTAEETLLCRAEAYAMQKEYDKAVADLSVFQNAFTQAGSLSREAVNDWGRGGYWIGERPRYYSMSKPTPIKELHPDFEVEAGEQENFIHSILFMRRLLTLHEGLRWFDVKRYGITIYHHKVDSNDEIVDANSYDALGKRDPRCAFQLPQDAISAGMKPNPR
jgi:tetratricopeptide (TPR) repeat protein